MRSKYLLGEGIYPKMLDSRIPIMQQHISLQPPCWVNTPVFTNLPCRIFVKNLKFSGPSRDNSLYIFLCKIGAVPL